jgi:hypothetical protein
MRLKPDKVESLAKKVTAALKDLKRLEFVASAEQVQGTIQRVILNDLRREDELEKEAEEILKEHRLKIDQRNLSYNTLVARAKQELARKKKIIL